MKLKTVGILLKTRHRRIFKVGRVFTFAAAAYNLVRMRNLAMALCISRGRSVSSDANNGDPSMNAKNARKKVVGGGEESFAECILFISLLKREIWRE